MANMLAKQMRKWRGKRCIKDAAATLGLPYGTYRKYEEGRRTPNALALAELQRRMDANTENVSRK